MVGMKQQNIEKVIGSRMYVSSDWYISAQQKLFVLTIWFKQSVSIYTWQRYQCTSKSLFHFNTVDGRLGALAHSYTRVMRDFQCETDPFFDNVRNGSWKKWTWRKRKEIRMKAE